jgi:hypothetical protein
MAVRRKRGSKLDPYREQIGKIADREIATLAGVSADAVRMFRQRHKIPSLRAYRKTLGDPVQGAAQGRPAASIAQAPMAPRSRRAFLLRLKGAKTETEWVILASNIVDAAAQAEGANRGEVLSLRYLGDLLS